MNECDPATSLNGKIEFITNLKQLLERASEMKDAVVPMHCFFPGLGVYLSNHAAVHKNSLNAVERNDSAESKPISGSLPCGEHNNERVQLLCDLCKHRATCHWYIDGQRIVIESNCDGFSATKNVS